MEPVMGMLAKQFIKRVLLGDEAWGKDGKSGGKKKSKQEYDLRDRQIDQCNRSQDSHTQFLANAPIPLGKESLFNWINVWKKKPQLLFSHSVISDSLQPHGSLSFIISWSLLDSCPLSWWCHTTILSSVIPFSSCVQSFPSSGSFSMSQFFISSGQNIGASASILPMNIQDWFPLGLTALISLQSKELSRVFSSSTVQKHQFFGTQPSWLSNSHIRRWLLEKP